MKTVATLALVSMLALGSPAAAGDVVEVRIVETAKAVDPAVPPVAPAKVPEVAKVLASIKTLSDGAGNLHAKCAIGDTAVALEGHVKAAQDGKARRLSIKFVYGGQSGAQEVNTNVVLSLNAPTVIGGLAAAGGRARLIVVTVKPDKAAGGKAE